MALDKSIPLVDVGELSKQRCKEPIEVNLKYGKRANFVGAIINGYKTTKVALMTRNAAESLCRVQNYLLQKYGYKLLILDAYRPLRAVKHFTFWAEPKEEPPSEYELERKQKHYPNIERNQLGSLGYVAMGDVISGHCYGNVVDLVLIDQHGKKLNMGVRFDYMDELSHITANAQSIGEEAYRYRQILSEAMQQFEFQPYKEEFWHFSHRGQEGREVKEPMDVEITSEMKGLGLS